MERLYGEYAPISEEVMAKINGVYGDEEERAREIAAAVARNSTIINQDLLFRGAAAINANYMKENTIPVEGTDLLSPKIRLFGDNNFAMDFLEAQRAGEIEAEPLLSDRELSEIPGFDKRKNFELPQGTRLYRVTSGQYQGLCFTKGYVTEKNGVVEHRILIDIANTPFEVLPPSWQKSNFDPFEFAYKLVTMYPNIDEELAAAAVHVYWLAHNTWAIDYNDPMGKPYNQLTEEEKDKDRANVKLAKQAVELEKKNKR